MKDTPFDPSVVQSVIDEYNLPEFGKATIREIVDISNKFCQIQKHRYICNPKRELVWQFSWLEYLPVTQGVAGSSPVHTARRADFQRFTTTWIKKRLNNKMFSLFPFLCMSHNQHFSDQIEKQGQCTKKCVQPKSQIMNHCKISLLNNIKKF